MSLEDGIVKGFDIRTAKSDSSSDLSSTFTLHAHDKPVSSVSYNPSAPNVCVFKIWFLWPMIMYFSLTVSYWTTFFMQLLATGSMDKTVMVKSILLVFCILCRLKFILSSTYYLSQVKLWDLSNNQPSCVASKSPKAVRFFLFLSFLFHSFLMGKFLWIIIYLLIGNWWHLFMVFLRVLSLKSLSQRTIPSCWLSEAQRVNYK